MSTVFSLVPQPAQIHETDGSLSLTGTLPLYLESTGAEISNIADYLVTECHRYCRINLKRMTIAESRVIPAITLSISNARQFAYEGAYKLTVHDSSISLQAGTPAGLFYAVQTLLQLLSMESNSSDMVVLPNLEIVDRPRFTWRGMHLDVSRHFFPVEFIKKYIDILSFHKMNIFHWHLTDDQGWRIEIKRYPRLTEIGAWRKDNGNKYGGFYSQDEIRTVVNYAEERYVTIVPEIEMPGHASAALASYPEYSCTGGPFKVETRWGVFDDVYCPGNKATFTFLENILDEVAELFPGRYIHIGGDECPKVRWHNHDLCQCFMKSLGLASENDLQAYFISHIARHLETLKKSLVGWDEILDGGAPSTATIMAWRSMQKGVEAAEAGHDVVMTPMSYCYFDHYQGVANEPKAIGGFTPLQTVYSFEPIPDELPSAMKSHIIGAQGNVWTEYMPDSRHVEYMVLPRLCALSEVLWSPRETRFWTDFLERLKPHLLRLKARHVNYRQLTM